VGDALGALVPLTYAAGLVGGGALSGLDGRGAANDAGPLAWPDSLPLPTEAK